MYYNHYSLMVHVELLQDYMQDLHSSDDELAVAELSLYYLKVVFFFAEF